MHRKLISIIIPAYNEQDTINSVYTQVSTVMQDHSHLYCYEIIFINDGSTDNSWSCITQLIDKDACIKGINFSRNFGHQAALSAGYHYAQGDAVISMDADLQDPPLLLIQMINAWENGAAIVYARRTNRKDHLLKKITAACYYKLLDLVADVSIPRNVGDFRLLDRQVVYLINQFPERARYLRGLVAWTGLQEAYVDFVRPERSAGQSGYTWKKMFQLAFDGLTGFSTILLKLALYGGISMAMFAVGCQLYMCYTMLGAGVHYSLEAWLISFVCLFLGMQSLFIWLLGEYVGRIYEQQKGRPLYVVQQELSCKEATSASLVYSACKTKAQQEVV